MKLSPTQQGVVLRMADGARLRHTREADRYFYLDERHGKRLVNTAVHQATVRALLNSGIVKWDRHDWGYTKEYVLTPAGYKEASRIRQERS